MKDLNDLNEIKKLDTANVFGSTEMLPQQCTQIWQDIKNTDIAFSNIKSIVICGMGGSAYGGHVVKAMYLDQMKIPLVIVNDYQLPAFIDSDTLVILTSYSGTTEEILSCVNEAKAKTRSVLIFTSGGLLAKAVKDGYTPGLVFEPDHNPSGQPRLGTGYIVLGTIAILNKIGIITVPDDTVAGAIDFLSQSSDDIKKSAKDLALKTENKIPLIIAAEFLEGNAHIIRNQINETAKSFSDFAILPELNHHLLEGLTNPKDGKLAAVFINSALYSDRIKKRIELTKDVVRKNNVDVLEYIPNGKDKISQMLEVLSLGGYMSFYLAILYDQNPSLIPWVDYFKAELKK